ncbi:low specificity L-threonine aldolase [Actinotalea sp. Marseille-Q4924]|uniref:threonine aldolase family protein n=1 Tax=Actinotalea sp. Marseille-Q4924 TaxID=2866571 RepID=UPI001CE3C34B|nr:low specificity L-threonine aldolase [Actinotalea sp. Marseille-Q4924]
MTALNESSTPSPAAPAEDPARDDDAPTAGRVSFASDNYAGVHPEVIEALARANVGHEIAYGEDRWTARLHEVMSHHFGGDVEVFPVFNGTGANVLSLQALLPPWGAVVCAETAHIHTDENGAPERVAGIKLLPVATPDGRLTPELVDRQAWGWGDEHRAQPLVVSITQTTELGTCYTPEEVRALADHAHARGMRLHLDGARISNAAASLDVPLRAFTSDAGVDVVSFGGTKNGLMGAEAVVVLDPAAATGLPYLRKMNMQLASKMRFISAQLVTLLEGDLWLRSARHANGMARRLRDGVAGLPGVRVVRPVEANAVFAVLPDGVADRLRTRFRFYDWDVATGEVRWMCAFDTTEADVDAFVAALREELERS